MTNTSVQTNLSQKEQERLDEISNIVSSADNPKQALAELQQGLSSQYRRPLAFLTAIIDND